MVFFNRRRGDSMIRQLEYIQSSGTQYINTGFLPNNNTRFVMSCVISYTSGSTVPILGARDTNASSGTGSNAFVLFAIDDELRYDYGSQTETISINPSTVQTVDLNKNVATFNGQVLNVSAQTFTTGRSLGLFTLQQPNGFDSRHVSMQLRSARIYDNGTLARDYLPCYDESGVVCLYDRVNKQYVYNAGTGSFVAGPEL